jgi:hypothetical protein
VHSHLNPNLFGYRRNERAARSEDPALPFPHRERGRGQKKSHGGGTADLGKIFLWAWAWRGSGAVGRLFCTVPCFRLVRQVGDTWDGT